MMRLAVAALCITMLSSCGFDKPPPASVESEASKPVPGTQVQQATEEKPETSVDHLASFADQLVEKGPGVFRFDRIREARDGGHERQVFVEVLGASDVEAADLSAEILEALGYVAGNRFGDENGVRLHYGLEGEEPVRVLVRTREAHSKLLNDSATSSVYLTQPVATP